MPYDRVSDHGRTLYKHIGSWSDRQIKNLSIRYFKIQSAHILHNFPRVTPLALSVQAVIDLIWTKFEANEGGAEV